MIGFGSLPRNARSCIAIEPLWAFFGPMVSYFMPLYQRQLGLDEVQMGIVNSVNIAAGLLFYTLAAPITNKFGRRNTSLWFDFIAWSLSMVLWAISKSFIWFVVAAITNAVVRIVYVSWNLLISEDANEEQRSTIFGYINIIGTFGGFTTFAGGMFIASLGIVPAMRGIFWLGAVILTAMFILRFLGTKETKTGLYLKEKSKGEHFLKLVAQQIPKAAHSLHDPLFPEDDRDLFYRQCRFIHRFLPDSLYERSEGSFLIRSFRYSGLERPRQHCNIFLHPASTKSPPKP